MSIWFPLLVVGVVIVASKSENKGSPGKVPTKSKKELDLAQQQWEEECSNRRLLEKKEREARFLLAKEASENGHSFCPSCLTIDPQKLCSRCGRCMDCGGGEYYTDTCYSCDDGS